MRIKTVVLTGLAAAMAMTMSARAQQTVPPENVTLPEMPKETTRAGKRVNRIIDMWLKNQPVYYTQVSGGGYEQGKQPAPTRRPQTKAAPSPSAPIRGESQERSANGNSYGSRAMMAATSAAAFSLAAAMNCL